MQLLMALHAHHIKALKQPVELALAPANHAIGVLARPLELRLLQTLVPQAEPGLIPVEHLEPVAMAVAEHIQRIVEGIERHLLLDDGRQAVDGLAKVHHVAVQIDGRQITKQTHRPAPASASPPSPVRPRPGVPAQHRATTGPSAWWAAVTPAESGR